MSLITIANVTNVQAIEGYDITATGVFDVIMEAVNKQIEKQWAAGRITGTDYATVYLGALQSVLQEAVKFTLSAESAGLQADEIAAKIDLIREKIITEQTNTVDATGGAAKDKSELMTAQTLGFSNDTKQKLFKQMIDGYSANLAIAGVANVPEATLDGAIDQLAQNILDSLTDTDAPTRVVIQAVPETPDVDVGT